MAALRQGQVRRRLLPDGYEGTMTDTYSRAQVTGGMQAGPGNAKERHESEDCLAASAEQAHRATCLLMPGVMIEDEVLVRRVGEHAGDGLHHLMVG